MSARPAGLTLRPRRADDEAFLRRLYASTREDELAPLGWTDTQREAFLDQQFLARERHYCAHFPAARFDVIERHAAPVGRLTVARRGDEICVLDIALMPEWRGAGIGSALLRELVAEAAAEGRRIVLHVEPASPARRLYERLGFRPLRAEGIRLLLEWTPPDGGRQEKIDS